ncbi:cytochrome b [Rhodanobacter sp. L36]|uniref:cytochrome b n=1 Tax=Rhodanobacter sp. L36 TaxID=1747221 RepID=UPI00131E4B57|nr:cytochrome b [Rhodanobacter sp. L36]
MSVPVPSSYTRVAITMHWLIALLILLNVALGFYMASFPKTAPTHDQALFYHASIGSLIFMLAIARLGWRLTHRPPALPATIATWQRSIAHILHWTLYVLMLIVPLSGYVHRLAGAHAVNFFGLGNLPVFIGKDEPLRLFTHALHETLVWVLCVLVVGHIGAALKHRLIDRDGVLQRMLRR